MAHQISVLDKVVTDMTTDRAWHHLDKPEILNGLSDLEFINVAGFDFDIICDELMRQSNNKGTQKYGVFSSRSDEMFRMVTERFNPISPIDFATWGNQLARMTNAKIVSAGTIKGTRLGFISLDLGNKISLPGGDEIKQYITLTIGWDGTAKVHACSVDWRTVCANTFPSPDCGVLGEFDHNGLRFDPHKAAGEVAETMWNRRKLSMQKYEDVLGKLADTQFRDGERDQNLIRFAAAMSNGTLLNHVVSIQDGNEKASLLDRCLVATIDQDAWRKVKTSGLSNMGAQILAETLNGLGSDMPSAKGTLWGALNGFTYYTDHLAGRGQGQGRKVTDDGMVQRNYFGHWDKQKQDALILLSAMANSDIG